MYKVNHFIFDFAGVMIESPNIISTLFEIINSDLGTNISKKDPYVSKLRRMMSSGRISSREFLEKIFEKYSPPSEKGEKCFPPKETIGDYYLDLWFNLYHQSTELYPEMEEIVMRLHDSGYTVSLLSNTYDIHAKSNELKGFFKLFDYVFLSHELGMRKPEIEKFKYVLKKLNANPEECIFIDDKLVNLVPARKLGLIAIHFVSFESFKGYLDAMGISNISEDMRKKIMEKYHFYKQSKKDYKHAKKEYKKLKSKYKKAKKKRDPIKALQLKVRLSYKKKQYERSKEIYKKNKEMKKKELKRKIKLQMAPEEAC
ncbi:MAG: HAD family hydrolase [Promethearchaeota archaeon]